MANFRVLPKFATFESPQALRASSPCAQGEPWIVRIRIGLSLFAAACCNPSGAARQLPLQGNVINLRVERVMFTQRATGVRTELVGAGLCSARRDAAVLRKPSANSYAPACLGVGGDAHIGPLGINEFTENYRKIAAFCGRTESSAPTECGDGENFL